ncbi:uncharacterized protein LOC127802471 [Diospyros lotus]|uniref:uncharacterized protein LOC127802471 n=1 Tax=Diospyros lotus TaxID=55363 RepID=UPI0022543E65|nr:uncharacterized protein LOC127802471 [Diospyros lotus]
MAAHGYASYKDDQKNGSRDGSDYPDHECRPVIVDAEGRRRPLISYHPSRGTGGYAVSTVEEIEHVRMPVVVAEYRYVSQMGMQPPRDYAYTDDQWHTPPSPEYKYRNQGTVEPLKAYGYKNEGQRSPPRLVGDPPEYKYHNNHGTDGPLKDYGSINERPHSRPGLVGNRPEYKYSSNKNDGAVKPPKVYGSIKERGPSPPRPAADRPQVVANDYDYAIPTKVVPLNSGVTNSRTGRPSSGQVGNPLVTNSPTKMEPLKTYGPSSDNKWQKTSKVSDDSQPKRPNFLPASKWRKNIVPNLTGQSGSTGYGDYDKYNNNEEEWNRPSGNTIRDGNNKDYYQRNDGWAEPTIANKDGGEESGNKGWTTMPAYITALSGPTNDISKAMEMLKEAASPMYITASAQQPSKEAARRYGNLKQSSKPFQEGYDYSGTIDSVQAARKYKGTTL